MIRRRYLYFMLFLAVMSLTFKAQGQNMASTKEVHMRYDFSYSNKTVNVLGPTFGVSWLMQNKFINTFDFAVHKNGFINANTYLNQNLISLSYQIMYSPDIGLKNLKTRIGLGFQNDRSAGYRGNNMSLLASMQYPIYRSYFIELIVPYNFYQSQRTFGPNKWSLLETPRNRNFSGVNLETRKLNTVKVGIGVSF